VADLLPLAQPNILDLAIAAWLHAKHGQSGSTKTATAYRDTLASFRAACQAAQMDLDGEVRALALLAQGWAAAGDPAAATYNQRLAIVSSFYSYAHKQGLLELAIAAWLHAKHGQSGSTKTATAYRDTLASFRAAAVAAQMDLDGEVRALALLAQGWAAAGDPAAATYNQRLAIVSSFYSYAYKQGLLEIANPIARVERRRVQAYAGAHALDYDDVKARLGKIDRTTPAGQRDYALIAIGLQTGRRLSELAGLQWGDLAIHGATITLTWRRTKGGKSTADTLPAPVSKALATWLYTYYGARLGNLPAETPVWVSLARNGTAGRRLSIRAIATVVEEHLGTSKVHALRHTFARAMEDTGAKVSDIQSRLQHSSLATTGRYLAALKAADNPQAAALAQLLGLDNE
jgi:site-specific recombinase XerD